MKLDLLELIRQDTAAQERCESYGLDPVRIEQYLAERDYHITDPTGDLACARADRDLARKRNR